MKTKIIFITLISSMLILAYPSISLAQKQSIGVYPPIVKIKAIPGSSLSVPIRVKNLEKEPIEARISLRPFKSDNMGRVSFVLYDDYTPENSSILTKVRLRENNQNVSKVVLSAYQEKKLDLQVNLDQKEEIRDYYFSVVFLSIPQESSENSHSNISIGTAANIVLSLGEKPNLRVHSFQSSPFTKQGRIKFGAEIQNDGKSFATVKPIIEVKNIFGSTVEAIKLNEATVPSKSSRILNDNGNPELKSEKNYFLGPYKASLTIYSEGKEVASSQDLSIIILPGREIIIPAAFAFMGIFIFLRVRAKMKS